MPRKRKRRRSQLLWFSNPNFANPDRRSGWSAYTLGIALCSIAWFDGWSVCESAYATKLQDDSTTEITPFTVPPLERFQDPLGGVELLQSSDFEAGQEEQNVDALIATKISLTREILEATVAEGELGAPDRLAFVEQLKSRLDQIESSNREATRPDQHADILLELDVIVADVESLARSIVVSGNGLVLTVSGPLPRSEWFSQAELIKPFTNVRFFATDIGDEIFEYLAPAKELQYLTIDGGAGSVTGNGLSRLMTKDLIGLELGATNVNNDALISLRKFPLLTNLQLSDTQVSSGALEHIAVLTELNRLKLDRTRIGDEGFAPIAALEDLENLGLSDTLITGDSLVHIADLTKMWYLDLRRTNIDDDSLVHLSKLERLEFLELQETPLNGSGFESLESLDNLISLNLNLTRVGDSAIRALGNLPQLTRIELSSTRVSDSAVAHLADSASLEYLDLFGTHITDASLEHLRDQRTLQKLYLGGTQITDDGLQHLLLLKDIVELDLRNTRITDEGLRALGNMHNLNVLLLGGTEITGQGLRHLANLDQLRVLDLTGTRIQDDAMETIARLPSLLDLNLSGTNVSDSALRLLANSRQLRVLSLEATNASAETLNALRQLPYLRELDLDESQVNDELASLFDDYPNLADLSLSHTALTDVGLKRLGGGFNSLEIAETNISDEGLRVLQRNSRLTSLNVSGTSITDAGLERLRAMPMLQSLNLSKTSVSDMGIHHLVQMPSLTQLDLTGTTVSDVGAETLTQLSQLESLHLEGTRVTVHGSSLLQRERPDLTVEQEHPWEWDQRWTFFADNEASVGPSEESSSLPLQDLSGLAYLHVDDRTFSTELLRSLSDNTSLEYLSFSGSRLSDDDLDALSEMSQLTRLDLSHTNVSDVGLKHLANLQNLRELNLRGTTVQGRGLTHLHVLEQLQAVDLSQTEIDDLGIQLVARMPNLRRLSLVETQISDDAIVALTGLPNLQYLDLYGTNLTDESASALSKLSRLRFCYLTNTDISDSGLAQLLPLQNLEELALDGTGITDSSLSTIAQFENLRVLRIGRTDVSAAGLTTFDPPRHLTSLELNDLPINDNVLSQLQFANQLTKLDLSGTSISDASLDTLADWPHLSELDIRDCNVSQSAIASFVSRRPFVTLHSGTTRQPIDGWSIALLVIYSIVVVSICFYGTHRLVLIVRFLRTPGIRKGPTAPAPQTSLPHVTVQLPMFNESRVARRVIEAACALDYPTERLQIQVLDDSTDESAALVKRICEEFQAKGHDIQWIHRDRREGFKGGALSEGMQTARGEYIAMFDADFVPPTDFLKRVLPYFNDNEVGVVQTEWSHLNRDESWLTQCQAIFLDGHFIVEQSVRSHAGRWFNFNGTAGVWRKSCIEDAGGWSHDTLTEDTDLSYRAQLAGWRFLYLPQVRCDAEIPSTMTAFLGQQHRWSKGLIQSGKKLLPKILFSKAPLATRLEAWCHLTAPVMYLVMFLLTLIALPALYISTPLNRWSELALALGIASLCLGTMSTTVYYLVSQRVQGIGWWQTLIRLPLLMGLGIGICVVNSQAVVTALIGWRSPFVRTPKFGGRADFDRSETEERRRRLPKGWIELSLAGVLIACLVLAFLRPFTLIGAPFLLLFAMGYLVVGVSRVLEPLREQTAGSMGQQRERSSRLPMLRPVPALTGALALSVIGIVAFAGVSVGLLRQSSLERDEFPQTTFGIDLTLAHWQTSSDSALNSQGAVRQVVADRDSLKLMIDLNEDREEGEIYLDLTGPLRRLGRSLDSDHTVSFELEYPSRFTGEFQAYVRDDQNRAEYGSMEFIESHDQRNRVIVTISPTRWIPPMGYQDEGFDAEQGMRRIGLKIAAQSDRVRGAEYRGFRGQITVSNIRIEERPTTIDDEPEIRSLDASRTFAFEPLPQESFSANSGLVRPWPLGYAFAGPVGETQQATLDLTFQAIQAGGMSYARFYLGDYRTGLQLDSNGLIVDVEDDFAHYVQQLIETANRYGVTPMICLTDNTMADGRGIEAVELITEGEQSSRFIDRVLMRFVSENRDRDVVWDIFNEPENVTEISLRRIQRYVDRVLEAGRSTDPNARFTVVSRGRSDLVFWQGRGLDLYAHNVFNQRALAESVDQPFDLDAPVVIAEIDPALVNDKHLTDLRNAGYESIGIWGWESDDKYNWDECELTAQIQPLIPDYEFENKNSLCSSISAP